MKLTNTHNLPEPYAVALGIDEYKRGTADFTATGLIKPSRIFALTEKYWDDLVEDVSDRVWAASGQAWDLLLERIGKKEPERYIVKHRFQWEMPEGATVSGEIDLYDRKTQTLYDHKETSVWKFILGDTREWEEQANINLFLMRMNAFTVRNLLNIAKLKDWKARKARMSRQEDYPQCAINVVELPMWSIGEAQAFIHKRIQSHQEARSELASGRNPLLCTKKERWQRDSEFAVMKKGQKRAVRKFPEQDRAYALLAFKDGSKAKFDKYYIEERPAEPVRCLDFCPVKHLCDFGIEAEKKWRESYQPAQRDLQDADPYGQHGEVP